MSEKPRGWLSNLPGDARRRHRLRVSILLLLAVGPGLYGWLTQPRAQEAPTLVGPSIVVLANQRNVAATVNMVLSEGSGGQSSELRMSILPTSKVTGPVTLTVELDDFPAGVTGEDGTPEQLPVIHAPAGNPVFGSPPEAAPTPAAHYADYAVIEPLGQLTPAQITVIARHTQIGEASQGAQLRVAFPDLIGEAPGPNPSVGYPLQDLYTGQIQASQLSSGQAYPLALQAGKSTFSAAGTGLAGYQSVAGDSPLLLGSMWAWNGINDATVLAVNVATQDREQYKVFLSGIALGVAGGAVIALLLELIPPEPADQGALTEGASGAAKSPETGTEPRPPG
jgi:hypothetical protein